MKDIRTAMAEIVRRQGLLTISAPIPESVKKAWDYFPPDSVAMPETPAFMNAWSFIDAQIDASLLVQHYVVHSQLFVADADKSRSADIATAFHVAWVASLATHPTLSGLVTDQKIRGGQPTLAILTRNNKSYVGLDLYMDVTLKDAITADAN